MKYTEEQLDMLRHMLGINDGMTIKPTRNYAATDPDDALMVEMERLGLVRRLEKVAVGFSQFEYWSCTELGVAEGTKSGYARRLPKKQRVYRKFLDVSDVVPDLTFKDFLTRPEYEGIRNDA